MTITLNKLFCQLNENLIFKTEIRKVFGIGANNTIYKKFGLTKNAHTGVIKIISNNLDYNIEYFLLSKFSVSFPLKQELKDAIQKKILMKTYQGYRHKIGLPVHGQRTHTNSKTVKKTLNIKLKFLGIKSREIFKQNVVKKKTISLKKVKKEVKKEKKKKK